MNFLGEGYQCRCVAQDVTLYAPFLEIDPPYLTIEGGLSQVQAAFDTPKSKFRFREEQRKRFIIVSCAYPRVISVHVHVVSIPKSIACFSSQLHTLQTTKLLSSRYFQWEYSSNKTFCKKKLGILITPEFLASTSGKT